MTPFISTMPMLIQLLLVLVFAQLSMAASSLTSSFKWQSSAALVGPKSDSTHNLVALKDPSIVYQNNRWHLFATTASSAGNWNMVYLSFANWSQANSAQQIYLDKTPIGGGYRAAPQKLWYLIYQTGANAAYSTNSDVGNPSGWSAPKNFYSGGMPSIVKQNIGTGSWVDFWNICDQAKCYLFSSDDNGHLYRSETTLANFPNGFGPTVIALSDSNKFALFEASNVYKIVGGNYLLIVEALGSTGRYFRSWTSASIAGTWTPLAASEGNPFARSSNVAFSGTPWTQDISHGEMIRAGVDQTLSINPCRLQYLYQGLNQSGRAQPYALQPWRLGLLTQTNSNC